MRWAAQPPSVKIRIISLIAVMGAIAGHGFYKNLFSPSHEPVDFDVFYKAAQYLAKGETPYRYTDVNWVGPYLYPQTLGVSLIPITHWPVETAARIWFAMNVTLFTLLIASGVIIGLKYAPVAQRSVGYKSDVWLAGTIAAVAALGFSPVHFGMRMGQCDLLIAAILLPILFFTSRAQPLIAGLCLGLGTIIKVSPMMLLPAIVAACGFRALITFSAVVGSYLMVLALTGTMHREYELFSSIIPKWQFNVRFPENSVYRLLLESRYTRPDGFYGGAATSVIMAALVALYGLTCLLLRRLRAGVLPCLAVGIALTHLTSPVLEPQHYTMTLLVLVPWIVTFFIKVDKLGLAAVMVCWLIGYLFLPLHNVSGLRWPSYSLLMTDCILIIIAFARPGRESPASVAT